MDHAVTSEVPSLPAELFVPTKSLLHIGGVVSWGMSSLRIVESLPGSVQQLESALLKPVV